MKEQKLNENKEMMNINKKEEDRDAVQAGGLDSRHRQTAQPMMICDVLFSYATTERPGWLRSRPLVVYCQTAFLLLWISSSSSSLVDCQSYSPLMWLVNKGKNL